MTSPDKAASPVRRGRRTRRQPTGPAPTGPEEWFEIKSHKSGKVEGLIPRVVAEALGVDCRPADRRPQGTIWFNREQSEAFRKHPRWEPTGQDNTEIPLQCAPPWTLAPGNTDSPVSS